MAVEQAGDDILACAVLAQNQDVGIRVAQLVHRVENGPHGIRFADDAFVGIAVAQGLHLLLQQVYFTLRAAQLHARGEGGQQLFLLPGFGNEVRSPRLDGTHSLVGVRVSGHEDNHRLRVNAQDLLQAVKSFLTAHHIAAEVHVQQHDVGLESRHEVFQPFRAGDDLYFLGVGLKQQVEGEKHVFVVVYNQYFSKFFHNNSISVTKIHIIFVCCTCVSALFLCDSARASLERNPYYQLYYKRLHIWHNI